MRDCTRDEPRDMILTVITPLGTFLKKKTERDLNFNMGNYLVTLPLGVLALKVLPY